MSTVTDTLRRDISRLLLRVEALEQEEGGGTVTSVAVDTGASGVGVSGSPITGAGTIGLALGTAAAAATGDFDPAGAAAAAQAAAIAASGTVTSVNADASATGMAFTGGPITTSGVLALDGVLNEANGGTGLNNRQQARQQYSSNVAANTSIPGGNTVANTTTETAFSSSYTIPANGVSPGHRHRVTLRGTIRTAISATTMQLRLKIAGATVLDTGALSYGTTSSADRPWQLIADIVTNSAGAIANAEIQGEVALPSATTLQNRYGIMNTGATVQDTTAARAITVTAQFGAAAANNTITLRQFMVEELPPI